VFAEADYGDAAVGEKQLMGSHALTVLDKRAGKNVGRTEIRVRLETAGASQGVVWRSGRWADDFVLVASNDGHFITLFTKKEDPAKDALVDFMMGRFQRLEAKRCLPWAALLFRTLVGELAAPLAPWERHIVFSSSGEATRDGCLPHSQVRPDARPIVPFLSAGRDHWLMYGFTEEKAHRQALYCEGQCRELISVFCHPTFAPHHRSRSESTKVVSLFELAELGGTGRRYLPQIRFLTNHMRLAELDVVRGKTLDEATADLASATEPQEIATSQLREARAALGIEIRTRGEAAYAFAAANLLNAAMNRCAGFYRGSQVPPKETYAFKQRVCHWIEGLAEDPIDGVRLYVDAGGPIYVAVGNVQFSFHAIASTPAIMRFAASPMNEIQEWSGRRLQAISPAVLAWGRAVFQAEGLAGDSQDSS
jgi:hypothetical protein